MFLLTLIIATISKLISPVLGIGTQQNFPPNLTPGEERQAFQQMRDGDEDARQKLILHNLRLVAHIVRKYYSTSPNQDDLVSIGTIGLVKAVDTFKHEYGTKFATYGARCIQNEILMFFRSQKKLQNEVSINEQIDIDKEGNPLTYMDIISTEDNIADDIDMRMHIERLRTLVESVLDKREREIIVLRYGLGGFQPRTQREVAEHLGISRSYVSRIEKKALAELKAAFGSSIPDFDG